MFGYNEIGRRVSDSLLWLRSYVGDICWRHHHTVVGEEFQRIVIIADAIIIDVADAALADFLCAEFV